MVSASSLLGAAGEHFVMCQLLRRGFIAALAPVGVPNCDIVVTDDIGEKLCAIQVKTRRDLGSDGGWHMGKKHEQLRSALLFYCFVDFGKAPEAVPVAFVVPAGVVGETLEQTHQAWLAQPGKSGKARNDSDFRRFLPDYGHVGLLHLGAGWLEAYREAWDLLQPSARAQIG
jgi:hypothetical protein